MPRILAIAHAFPPHYCSQDELSSALRVAWQSQGLDAPPHQGLPSKQKNTKKKETFPGAMRRAIEGGVVTPATLNALAVHTLTTATVFVQGKSILGC